MVDSEHCAMLLLLRLYIGYIIVCTSVFQDFYWTIFLYFVNVLLLPIFNIYKFVIINNMYLFTNKNNQLYNKYYICDTHFTSIIIKLTAFGFQSKNNLYTELTTACYLYNMPVMFGKNLLWYFSYKLRIWGWSIYST